MPSVSVRFVAILTAVALAVWIAIIVASGAGWNPFDARWDFSNSGAFGDSFGPLSALMASIAAVSAIAAYRSQSAEITRVKERQEAADAEAKKELSRLLARERKADKQQQKREFEQTFFNLLEAFRSITAEIDITTNKGTNRAGQDAFKSMASTLSYQKNLLENDLRSAWRKISATYANDLNHYFRFLYHLIRFVHDSKQSTDQKYFYVRLVRALLSEYEILFLGLNCHYGEGREKFRPLVKEYALLHNLSKANRQKWGFDKLYGPAAFGES